MLTFHIPRQTDSIFFGKTKMI